MTKNILLAATALSALAFAGSASAIDITAATVSGVNNAAPATLTNAYRLASEAVIGTGLATTGATTAVSSLSTTSGLAVGTYVLRFDYTGIAGFTATPTLGLGTPVGCTVASSLSTGGGTTQNFVEFAVTVSGATCTTNPIFTLTAPFNITTLGNVTVKSGLTLNGVGIDNSGSAVARTIVNVASGYVSGISGVVDGLGGATDVPANASDNADFPTRLALGSGTPYTAFSTATGTDLFIGSVGYIANASPTYLQLDGQAGDLASANMPTMTITLNGALTGVTASLATDDTNAGPVASTTNNGTSATFTGVAGARYNVRLVNTGTTTQLSGGAYTGSFTSAANVLLSASPSTASTSLETVGLEGVNFIAPWVQSTNANYNTVIRVSNSGTVTGPVTLTMNSPLVGTNGSTCSSTTLAKLVNVPAGGELAINSADLTTCFGAFTRADVRVNIQGSAANLTAKLRIVNPGALVTEQTLGSGVLNSNGIFFQ